MTRDYDNQPDDHSGNVDNDLNEFAQDPLKGNAEQTRAGFDGRGDDLEQDARDNFSSDYEDFDEESYDEPERDTAYPPAYREEEDDTADLFEEQQPLLRATGAPVKDRYADFSDEEDEEGSEDRHWNTPQLSATDSEEWLDEPDYEDPERNVEYGQKLPMGLLIIAVVAVILLIAGGYGVMQERAESNAEIRSLRAALATAASSEDIDKAYAEAETLRVENNDLADRVYDLQTENRKLTDLVAGLEAQVDAAITPAQPVKPISAPKPKVAAELQAPPQITSTPANTAVNGAWFVNFGSYGQESAARTWQSRLKPATGEVITAPGERDGRTFYRVRIINLPDKAAADAVARALEAQYDLPRLWVGKQ